MVGRYDDQAFAGVLVHVVEDLFEDKVHEPDAYVVVAHEGLREGPMLDEVVCSAGFEAAELLPEGGRDVVEVGRVTWGGLHVLGDGVDDGLGHEDGVVTRIEPYGVVSIDGDGDGDSGIDADSCGDASHSA